MLNSLGTKEIGHGVIKEFSEEILMAQLQKRNFDMDEYDKRIDEEFRKEQPQLYRMMEHTISRYAIQYADKECIGGTEGYDECLVYWKSRIMFILSLMYKTLSVGIECEKMEG